MVKGIWSQGATEPVLGHQASHRYSGPAFLTGLVFIDLQRVHVGNPGARELWWEVSDFGGK